MSHDLNLEKVIPSNMYKIQFQYHFNQRRGDNKCLKTVDITFILDTESVQIAFITIYKLSPVQWGRFMSI